MDLMTGKTSFSLLKKKYMGMESPSFHIIVSRVDLIKKLHCNITDLIVELTAGYEASGCSFTILHQYDAEGTKFEPAGAYQYVQVGAPVEIELGYINTETVFSGYVAEVEYYWSEDNMTPQIRVSCTDAKCLLMKTQRMEILKEQKLSQTVSTILKSRPASAYLKGDSVENLSMKEEIIRRPEESDYDFLVRCARYTGCEFFIVQGKAYFRKRPKTSSSVMTLSFGQGLLGAKASLRGEKIVKEIEVTGIDPESGKAVKGKARIKGKFSAGPTGMKMIDSTVKTYFDENVKNAGEASARAEILMQELQKDFMVLHGSCLGIPELVPGRTVKLKGLTPDMDKTWYIEQVRHILDERGYTTAFEARLESL